MICDLAETYGIFDYTKVPIRFLAILVTGLNDSSRVAKAIAGLDATKAELLLAAAVDNLSFLAWTKTKAAQSNKGRPDSIVEALLGKDPKNEELAFDSPKDFEFAREKILRGEIDGN